MPERVRARASGALSDRGRSGDRVIPREDTEVRGAWCKRRVRDVSETERGRLFRLRDLRRERCVSGIRGNPHGVPVMVGGNWRGQRVEIRGQLRERRVEASGIGRLSERRVEAPGIRRDRRVRVVPVQSRA